MNEGYTEAPPILSIGASGDTVLLYAEDREFRMTITEAFGLAKLLHTAACTARFNAEDARNGGCVTK